MREHGEAEERSAIAAGGGYEVRRRAQQPAQTDAPFEHFDAASVGSCDRSAIRETRAGQSSLPCWSLITLRVGHALKLVAPLSSQKATLCRSDIHLIQAALLTPHPLAPQSRLLQLDIATAGPADCHSFSAARSARLPEAVCCLPSSACQPAAVVLARFTPALSSAHVQVNGCPPPRTWPPTRTTSRQPSPVARRALHRVPEPLPCPRQRLRRGCVLSRAAPPPATDPPCA
ncbi:hypothetical protein P154DRAFT_577777 [Amniculicola lignicola CBS 123094]|uniref:Uncharacterized protein n=1 Tax=Amniculicola lignicola CBS 123094 TaxID=1392246 RepID=A0A6A5WCZ5_9PLEO|nr:hypothetical protein P154DRAFT_577777 [Amniculicola lignicola CBS 123094]